MPKRYLIVPSFILLSIVTFKLLEPVFTYKFGWEKIALNELPPQFVESSNAKWLEQSQLATSLLSEVYQEEQAPAISAAVSVAGETVWRGAIGYASLETKTPVSLEHSFRLGSTSKVITSVAVATLVDQGVLQFDTKMGDLDSSLDAKINEITVEQAMSHRAGIRNYGICFCFPIWEHQNRKQFSSIRESISVIESSELLSEPGTKYSYTSLGYNLAGLAVEKSSNKTFLEALKTNVFLPLKMKHTSLEDGAKHNLKISNPYDVENNSFKPAVNVDNSIRWASGGMLSTPSDMLKLGNAMLDNRLISEKVRTKITTVPEQGRERGGKIYALGWRKSNWKLKENYALESYHHNGVAVGSISIFVIFPDNKTVISAMMNKGGTNTSDLSKLVKNLALIYMPEP